jgi:hypothetical protein
MEIYLHLAATIMKKQIGYEVAPTSLGAGEYLSALVIILSRCQHQTQKADSLLGAFFPPFGKFCGASEK